MASLKPVSVDVVQRRTFRFTNDVLTDGGDYRVRAPDVRDAIAPTRALRDRIAGYDVRACLVGADVVPALSCADRATVRACRVAIDSDFRRDPDAIEAERRWDHPQERLDCAHRTATRLLGLVGILMQRLQTTGLRLKQGVRCYEISLFLHAPDGEFCAALPLESPQSDVEAERVIHHGSEETPVSGDSQDGVGDEARLRAYEAQLVAGLRDNSIPRHMHEGLVEYVMRGLRPGDFLVSVLANDLAGAAQRADVLNRHVLREYVYVLKNHAPAPCWGSPALVEGWVNDGGLWGRRDDER